MPHLISFMLLVLAVTASQWNGIPSNLPFDAGLLLIAAFLAGIASRRFDISPIFGFLLVGVIAGHNGLGFVTAQVLSQGELLESLVILIVVTESTTRILGHAPPRKVAILVAIGAGTAICAAAVAGMFLYALPPTRSFALPAALFAATTAPISAEVLARDDSGATGGALALGGMLGMLCIWGVATALVGDATTSETVRTGIMPMVVGITSLVMGIVWGYVMHQLGTAFRTGAGTFTIIAGSFLILPCMGALGLDVLLLGAGMGLFIALLSPEPNSLNSTAYWSVPALFITLGLRISISHIATLGPGGWIRIGIIVIVALAVRTVAFNILPRVCGSVISRRTAYMAALPAGPAAILFLRRFLPGHTPTSEMGPGTVDLYVIFSGAIFVMIVIATISERFTRPRTPASGTD
jgi:potassium/hydrogen antiporter